LHILLLEDQPSMASFLSQGLSEEGHVVEHARDIGAARALLAETGFDLLLIDRNLPDGDGLDLIRSVRQQGSPVPAICLTARGALDERVQGLTHGADDYLVKPFAFDELLARILAVSRRAGSDESAKLVVGELVLDLAGLRVFRAGTVIDLTAQEFRLLRYFAEHAGRVLSRTQLLDRVWGMRHDPGTNVVEVYVSYLRKKLDRDFDYQLLHTVRGMGYVLEDRR